MAFMTKITRQPTDDLTLTIHSQQDTRIIDITLTSTYLRHIHLFMQPAGDEEPVCQYPAITEACKPQCTTPWAKYEVSDGLCRQ